MVYIDDTIVEVYGHAKQGASFGYSGVRGLNALLATVSTEQAAPVIAAQRLRKGSAGSPRGAARLATDTLALIRAGSVGTRPVRGGVTGAPAGRSLWSRSTPPIRARRPSSTIPAQGTPWSARSRRFSPAGVPASLLEV